MQDDVPAWLDKILVQLPHWGAIAITIFAFLYAFAIFALPLFVWAIRVHAIKIRESSAESRDELRRIRQALERAYPPPRSGP